MQSFIELITLSFAAGESKVFEMSGDYFELIDAPYPVTVELSDRNGGLAGSLKLAEQSFNIKTEYSRITLKSPTAQTVRFGYGSGEVGNRRTAGVVSVVDGGKARTLANQSFFALTSCNPVAAQYPHVQLWNNSTTKRAIVSKVVVSSGSSSNINIRSHNAAFSTLCGTPNPGNKFLGQAASTLENRFVNSAAIVPIGPQLANMAVNAAQTQILTFAEPIVVPPGQGICAHSFTLNADLNATFEFYEETI